MSRTIKLCAVALVSLSLYAQEVNPTSVKKDPPVLTDKQKLEIALAFLDANDAVAAANKAAENARAKSEAVQGIVAAACGAGFAVSRLSSGEHKGDVVCVAAEPVAK